MNLASSAWRPLHSGLVEGDVYEPLKTGGLVLMNPKIGQGGRLRGYIRETASRKELLGPVDRASILSGGQLYGYGDQLLDLLVGCQHSNDIDSHL
jgi:hypothetical protein